MALASAVAAALSAVAAISPAAGRNAANPHAARAAQPAPTVPAKLDCAALVQDGATRNRNVPDFQQIPEAPTRITSARVVAATETEPEHCEVAGYVHPSANGNRRVAQRSLDAAGGQSTVDRNPTGLRFLVDYCAYVLVDYQLRLQDPETPGRGVFLGATAMTAPPELTLHAARGNYLSLSLGYVRGPALSPRVDDALTFTVNWSLYV